MYTESVDKGRISLGRALRRLSVAAKGCTELPCGFGGEYPIFMRILAETSEGKIAAAAVMMSSYASFLASELERSVRMKHGGRMDEGSRRAARKFANLFESSILRSSNRAHIPQRVREHAGIPLYCGVFVAQRNGYAVISPNKAIGEIESVPANWLATTIDVLVAGMAGKERRNAAEIYQ